MSSIRRLDEACTLIMGQAPKGDAYNNSGNGWPLIAGAGDFREGRPAPKKHTTEASKLSGPGDIILGIRASIGDKVLSDGEYCLGRGVAALRPNSDVDSRFLWHWLTYSAPILAAKGKGATFKQVNRKDIGEMSFPVLALPEQQRIAQVLDRADAMCVKRRKTLGLLDDLAHSIFADMFDEGIRSERWKVLPLADAVRTGTIVTYGIVQAGDEYPGGVPYIRTGDIKNGEIAADQLRRTDPAIAAKFSRSRVDVGDIVMSIRATVGTTAAVTSEISGANLTQGTARISPGDSTDHSYLLYYLRSRWSQEWIARQVKGATFREITLARLRELRISIPPPELQDEFARRIAELDRLRQAQVRHLAGLESLFASLQYCAFQGGL
ncbi:restriction endonuclease subunit S [Streptomyces sp. NPDC057011]|uniref:restriction endonuclease subunit S n=1 Tax=unclassified Streptomyces TaxID=2593676 RepID=UPI003634EF16